MGIKEMLGLAPEKKVRYAIVGVGDIAQEDMMPGVEHTGNSEITALVTGDPVKAKELGERYKVEATYAYEQFSEALRAGTFDAIYLATPNWRHAEFIIPALQAGIHVLTEKPLEVSSEKCEEILAVAKASSAKLMVAYRLHFEPGTLDSIEQLRSGKVGQLLTFTSTFAQPMDPRNHRAHAGDLAGPVFDMGPYPVNAARYMFSDEPTEVLAVGSRHPDTGFDQTFDDTVAVTLRFPQNRLAQFTLSYYGGPVNSLTVVGTEGSLVLDPSYTFGKPVEQTLTIGEKKHNSSFKNTDHFGGELKYFSDCILQNTDPEPDGEEGLADVRVLEAILTSLKTGDRVTLPPFSRTRRIDTKRQKIELGAVSTPKLVHADNPAKGTHEQPKN